MISNQIRDAINDYMIDNRFKTEDIKQLIKYSLNPDSESNPLVEFLETEMDMDKLEAFENSQKYFILNFPNLFSDVVSLSNKNDIMLVDSPKYKDYKYENTTSYNDDDYIGGDDGDDDGDYGDDDDGGVLSPMK